MAQGTQEGHDPEGPEDPEGPGRVLWWPGPECQGMAGRLGGRPGLDLRMRNGIAAVNQCSKRSVHDV